MFITLTDQLFVDNQILSYTHVPDEGMFDGTEIEIKVKNNEKIHAFVDMWSSILSNCNVSVTFHDLLHSAYLTNTLNVTHVRILGCNNFEAKAFSPNVTSVDFAANVLDISVQSLFMPIFKNRQWFPYIKKITIKAAFLYFISVLFPNLEELECGQFLEIELEAMLPFLQLIFGYDPSDVMKNQPKIPPSLQKMTYDGIETNDIERWYDMGIREMTSSEFPINGNYSHLPGDLIIKNGEIILHGKQHVTLSYLQ
jgi:hypothetical protein